MVPQTFVNSFFRTMFKLFLIRALSQMRKICQRWMETKLYLHVNFHDVVNMKPRPINAVAKFLRASERLVVAAFFMIWVSSASLLKSSPVRVTS